MNISLYRYKLTIMGVNAVNDDFPGGEKDEFFQQTQGDIAKVSYSRGINIARIYH